MYNCPAQKKDMFKGYFVFANFVDALLPVKNDYALHFQIGWWKKHLAGFYVFNFYSALRALLCRGNYLNAIGPFNSNNFRLSLAIHPENSGHKAYSQSGSYAAIAVNRYFNNTHDIYFNF